MDLVDVVKGTIARVYLLDAFVELLLVVGWGGVTAASLSAEPPFATP